MYTLNDMEYFHNNKDLPSNAIIKNRMAGNNNKYQLLINVLNNEQADKDYLAYYKITHKVVAVQ